MLFLGEWCCRPNQKHIWKKLDYKIAKPFYPNLKTRLHYSQKSDLIYDEIISLIPDHLNKIHQKSYDKRFWEILVGPFLKRYIRVVFNRYLTLKQLFHNYSLNETIHLKFDKNNFSIDTLSFIKLSDDDLWNHSLYIWLINDFFADKVEIITKSIEINSKDNNLKKESDYDIKKGNMKNIVKYFLGIINKSICNLSRGQEYFLYKTYLSKSSDFYLSLSLKQVPCRWESVPNVHFTKQSTQVERLPFNNIINKKGGELHIAIENYLHRLMPEIYLENFLMLEKEYENSNWPHSPKVIFTGNAFDLDEKFKFYTAKKTNKGTKYIVSQHGSVYGVNPFFSYTVEERTSDSFLTWGWKNKKNHVPGFCFNTIGRNLQASKKGGLLLLELILRKRLQIWDTHEDHNVYMKNQLKFIKNLRDNIFNNTTIRLYSEQKRSFGDEHNIFKINFPNITIDKGEKSFFKVVKNYRLIVTSYDSAGILELLNMNIPVIAFWDKNGFDQVSNQASELYKELEEVGILFYSPETASEHINKIWINVSLWWNSKSVQNARRRFCLQYSSKSSHPIKELAGLLQ